VLGILGTTLYLAVNISKHKDSEPAEKVSANSPASKPPHSSPVHEKQVVQKPVMASPQQTGIDEQKGAELNMKAHKLITEGRYAEAIPMLEQALKTFPKNSTAPAYKFVLYNLGHSLRRVGRTKEAVPYLDRCVKIDSEWEKARTELQIALATTQTTQ